MAVNKKLCNLLLECLLMEMAGDKHALLVEVMKIWAGGPMKCRLPAKSANKKSANTKSAYKSGTPRNAWMYDRRNPNRVPRPSKKAMIPMKKATQKAMKNAMKNAMKKAMAHAAMKKATKKEPSRRPRRRP